MTDKPHTPNDAKSARRSFLKVAGLASVGGAAVLTACAKKEEPAADAKAAPKAAPAVVKKRIEIDMVSTWPRDFPGLGTGAQRFAGSLETISDGRFKVNYFSAGEKVKAFDSFDDVSSGNSQIYHSADYYWKGKHPGWAYFSSVPFGLTNSEFNAWYHFGGGEQLHDELAASAGLKGLPCGNTGVQMGGWFRNEINSVEDLKGLKMRIPGLGGDVVSKLGVSPVSLPGGQIYESLVSGAIDATEWIGPWNDSFMKFYEVAKYYYHPGMHEPGTALNIGINKQFWDGLSKADQALVRAAAESENSKMAAEYNAKNGLFLEKLLNEQGVKLRKFSDEISDSFGQAAEEVFAEVENHSDLARRIHTSFLQARKEVGGWAKIADVEYIRQRNRVLGI